MNSIERALFSFLTNGSMKNSQGEEVKLRIRSTVIAPNAVVPDAIAKEAADIESWNRRIEELDRAKAA